MNRFDNDQEFQECFAKRWCCHEDDTTHRQDEFDLYEEILSLRTLCKNITAELESTRRVAEERGKLAETLSAELHAVTAELYKQITELSAMVVERDERIAKLESPFLRYQRDDPRF